MTQNNESPDTPGRFKREDPEKLVSLGRTLEAAEKIAPTHPHPSTAGSSTAQWTVGPFASLLDHARDAIKEVTNRH
jgi:hypothetical protein